MQLNFTENFKFDNTSTHRHARFGYGPLLGLLFANLLSNSVVAKFNPLGALKISYEPIPWTTYNKPPHDHTQNNGNYWQPLRDPYAPPPIPPTASIADATETQHIHHHHHISSIPNQQQIVSINGGHPPTEIIIDEGDYDTDNPDTTESNSQSTIIEDDSSYLESSKTNIETPRLVEPIGEESRPVAVRELSNQFDGDIQREKKSVKRGVSGRYSNNKRNKYNSLNRRRYTSTPDYYEYDSYEDFTMRSQPKRSKPKRPVDSYEDNTEESTEEYEYDSYELTTKPYKKRKRTTTSKPKRSKTKTKNKKKPQKVVVDYEEEDEDDVDEKLKPLTQIIEIRPRQEITTPETEITEGTTTANGSTNNTGYGYGPSNGYENISITYGPPSAGSQSVYGPPNQAYGPPKPVYGPPLTGNGQYQIPYDRHGSLDGSPNFVRQIHDIFEFDNAFH